MTKQEKAAIVSIAVNLALTLIKFVLASVTASIALLAESYHSMADILSSVMVLLAVRADRLDHSNFLEAQEGTKGKQPPARNKPKIFTPGTWGNKAAMIIGGLLILAAVNIFGRVSQSGTASVRYPLSAAAILGFLALCSYLLYRFESSVGEDTRSNALIADGRHAQTDMLASVLVVISLIADKVGLGFDRIAAGIIALYILTSALFILAKALRSYAATSGLQALSRDVIYEDILFLLVYRAYSRIDESLWERVSRFPGLKGTNETVKKRVASVLIVLLFLIVSCAYAASGIYVLGPGEEAIIERFGKPLHTDSPVGPGLHYHWPWPVERVKMADVKSIRRLTIGYKTGDEQFLILWTNKHYLREYSLITGEGPFLDVAMNVHYRVQNLYNYLFNSAEPDSAIKKIGYNVLRETLGIRPFFSSITADRDALEDTILAEMQRRVDDLGLGLLVQNVCFRDLHPPTQVASAFEDVVSAQEDYETYIEEAHGYRMDLLPRVRAAATTTLNDAEAYRIAQIAQSQGKARFFLLQQEVYRNRQDVTKLRMVLETIEEALSGTPKYVVSRNGTGENPDLWFSVPPFAQIPPLSTQTGMEAQPKQMNVQKKFEINGEEDLIDAITRFHQERAGAKK